MSKVFKKIGNAITKVVKGVVNAVVKVVTAVVKAVVTVAMAVVNFVTQPFMGMLGGMPTDSGGGSSVEEAARQQGVLVQTQGSNVSIPVVYGYRKVGGTVVFAETGSTNNRYLYVAYVFSEGLVEGLREVYIDDWLLPVNLTASVNAGGVVNVNADRYNGRVRLQFYPGRFFANVADSPVGATVRNGIFAGAPSFKNTMDFNGLTVMFARYEWKDIKTQADADNNPFAGGIPQLQISLLGVRVASLLVDAQATEYEAAPVRYSTNPAEILLDYLRNPRYGKGLRNADIHWPTWYASARKCNQTVSYLAATNIQGPILTCNTVIPTDQTIFSNVKNLLMGFRAYMPYIQGKYKLKIEDAGNETDILSGSATIFQTFTKDDIIGEVVYTGIEKSAKYNVVAVNYVDPDQKFSVQQVIFPETEQQRQRFIDLDGGRENKSENTFPTITNYAIAKDFARLLFNKSRKQETCTITVSSKALELEPGDNIRIQSNILNFGTDPWRIISFRLNDDMSVELGCVRNPDDIYPYTRVGEEDYVTPLFTPKGSVIYYPGSDNRSSVGLIPPTNAVMPGDFVPSATHPIATDPNGVGGGGVGGGSPGGGSAGPVGLPPTVPPSTENNTVTPPLPPPPYDAVLSLKRTTATIDPITKSATFNIVFTQPDAAMYDRAVFWWRLNRYSSWTEIQLTTKPGPGGEIPVTVSGLQSAFTTPYEYYVRTYAADGRAAIKLLQGQFKLEQNTGGGLVGAGTAGVLTISQGWSLPFREPPPIPVYNDDIDFLEIRPKLVNSFPQEPRRMSVSITQLQQVLTKSVNSGIEGFIVYYKFKGDTYWSYERFKFAELGVSSQQNAIVDLAGDFGASVYPADIALGGNNLQQYEFLVRLTYTDGTLAQKQLGPALAPVEFPLGVGGGQGSYNFIAAGTTNAAYTPVRSRLIPLDFFLYTVDDDLNRTFPEGSDIVPVLTGIRADFSESRLNFQFIPPTNSKFRGYVIRYREVLADQNPLYTELTVSSVSTPAGFINGIVNPGAYQHQRRFEWVITAQFSLNGVRTNSNKSLVAKVTVPFGVELSSEGLLNSFNFKTIDTTLALGQLATAFPANPTINPKSWIKHQVFPTSRPQDSALGGEIYQLPDRVNRLNIYYKFTFQPSPTSTGIVVYRRVYNTNAAIQNNTIRRARYLTDDAGLGAWERASVDLSELPTDAEGFKTMNVRGPLSPLMFDEFYEVLLGRNNLFDRAYGPTPSRFPDPAFAYSSPDYYPYHGHGNSPLGPTVETWAEYLFVLRTGATEESRGLLLRDFFTPGVKIGPAYQREVDGFATGNVSKDTVVQLSLLNNFIPGYTRNLNEAIPAVPIDKLAFGGQRFPRVAPLLPTSTDWVTLNNVISAPVGVTIY